MKKNLKKAVVSSLTLAMLVAAGVGIAAVPAKAEVSTTTMVTRLTGAAARVESSEDSGLRFYAEIDRAAYDAAKADAEITVGMIIVPTEYIAAAGGYTHEALTAKYGADGIIDVSYDEAILDASEYDVYAASIINIKDANYAREFTAIAYISEDGAYSYGVGDMTGEDYSRSIYEVSTKAYTSGKETDDTEAILKTYIDGVVEIENEAGEVSIALPFAEYESPYQITETAENAWLVTPKYYQDNARINVKSMLYNGERKTNFNVVDGETNIHVLTTGGDDAYNNGNMQETILNSPTSANLNGRQTGSSASLSVFNSSAVSYIAFDGDYAAGTYLDFYFKGNNMPQVAFYADKINGLWGSDGGKGLLLSSGITNSASSTTRIDDMLVFGPNRISDNYVNGKQLITYGDSTEGDDTYHPLSQGYLKQYADTEFKYTVGTYNVGGTIYLDVALYAKNAEGNYEVVFESFDSTKQSAETLGTGSIILYAAWTGSIGDSNARTVFEYTAPYQRTDVTPTLMKGVTKNADGSVTLDGIRPTHAGYGSGVGNTGLENSYIAWYGEYGAGYYLDLFYQGNNMPYVTFFADTIDGYLGTPDSGTGADGKGLVILNGIVDANNKGNYAESSDYLVYDALTIWGPNGYKGNHAGSANYITSTTEYPALMQSGLNGDTYKDTNFKLTIGTFINKFTGTIYVDVTLYNLDASETESLYAFNINTGLTEEQLPAANIIVQAPMKGEDGSATVNGGLDSTFKYVAPYFVEKEKAVTSVESKGMTENDDGSVTLAGGDDQTMSTYTGQFYGKGYGSGASTYKNNYVAFSGEYGVGTYVTTQFTGDNMPCVTLFAGEINQWIGAGHASYPNGAPVGQTGYLITNYIVSNTSAIDATANTKYMEYLYCHGPNRIAQNLDVATETNFTVKEGAYAALEDGVTYTYVVGSYENAEGKVVIEATLYNAEGGVIWAMEYNTGSDKATVEALGSNIILFAGVKGCDDSKVAYTTTFYYVDPTSSKPTYQQAIAAIDAKKNS